MGTRGVERLGANEHEIVVVARRQRAMPTPDGTRCFRRLLPERHRCRIVAVSRKTHARTTRVVVTREATVAMCGTRGARRVLNRKFELDERELTGGSRVHHWHHRARAVVGERIVDHQDAYCGLRVTTRHVFACKSENDCIGCR